MSTVSPETANRRLANVQFISNDVDIALFEALRLRCESLRDPDEKLPTVQYQEPEAWRRQYSVYLKLKQRAAIDRDPEGTVRAQQSAEDERSWGSFVQQHTQLVDYLKRESVSRDTLDYIGLQLPNDLELPIATGDDAVRFGAVRLRGWRDRAARVSTALWKLQQMTSVEKLRIPDIMEQRRQSKAISLLSEKLKHIEEKFEWLDGRLAAAESQSIDRNNKH
jgi:hypothetical protein